MNIYCFSTLSFAKLQFKSVINKAFHKHGVASFTDAWIETIACQLVSILETVASFTDAWIETQVKPPSTNVYQSHLLQMRGLKQPLLVRENWFTVSHLLQMRGLKRTSRQKGTSLFGRIFYRCVD